MTWWTIMGFSKCLVSECLKQTDKLTWILVRKDGLAAMNNHWILSSNMSGELVGPVRSGWGIGLGPRACPPDSLLSRYVHYTNGCYFKCIILHFAAMYWMILYWSCLTIFSLALLKSSRNRLKSWPSSRYGPKSDVFSLGCSIFEAGNAPPVADKHSTFPENKIGYSKGGSDWSWDHKYLKLLKGGCTGFDCACSRDCFLAFTHCWTWGILQLFPNFPLNLGAIAYLLSLRQNHEPSEINAYFLIRIWIKQSVASLMFVWWLWHPA